MSALTKRLEEALEAAHEQEVYIAELHDQLSQTKCGVRVGPAETTFPERLEWAIRHWGGYGEFAREMGKMTVRGRSSRALADYRAGLYKPKRAWMVEAAKILNVDFEWLAGQ